MYQCTQLCISSRITTKSKLTGKISHNRRSCVRHRLLDQNQMKVQCTAELKSELDSYQQAKALPTRMNSVPHERSSRQFFYDDIAEGVLAAAKAGEKRLQAQIAIPETNPQQDVYRIGTVLECVRDVAYRLAQDGAKVKMCVQQSMGQGVFQGLPLSLSGVRQIMEYMDWGELKSFVSFGQVGADQIDESQYYILIAPQNIVGGMIVTSIAEMVDKAEELGKTCILLNPILKDVPSSGGVMGVRGRKERIEFVESFAYAYNFRYVYFGATLYPISGAVRYCYGGKYELYKRVDVDFKQRLEEYQLRGLFEKYPTSDQIKAAFSDKPKKQNTFGWF
eukprot:TRINITY_DN3018_c1_g1_i2.p1 TRINITY_DN3018_c1_g1~~TRINITY_DN3018_c1_g1_i2.p1  ORF type:complete len:335 (+),score=30.03 TRINITY_DN3018_c1_g1_i2:92-1096(+)